MFVQYSKLVKILIRCSSDARGSGEHDDFLSLSAANLVLIGFP